MDQNHERPDHDRVSRILDELEEARWTHVGEVRDLVDPGDSELLKKLADECERRLASAVPAERRDRLRRMGKRLRTTAALNEVLPVLPLDELLPRPGEEGQAFGGGFIGPGGRRRTRRGHTSPPVPGFEAYHTRVTRWIEEKGLSQSSLAQHLGVDPSYLSRAIRGERRNRQLFLKIEELTGVAAPFVPDSDEDAKSGREADAPAPPDADEKPDRVN